MKPHSLGNINILFKMFQFQVTLLLL